ncbi:putative P-loop containing nucleoside triphosphate hydrolase, leucine-rich repeat domain, L [Rosa chinensis]|uniref:Putative P-loop containing nucleoside triphosphate hydrolase, leucine-rich repeat domain, L n=1 Tax=Rosa chinensis TaxID=74649 RepID=A0A2P6QS40_ROSCH|nr:disease resistance protein At4g27190-like [Rosa chinensis]XP_040374483.1 disease resistance protein At4g27190-like [Rosa chinensis]XP_040374484.1 disease resistance protein At4g27190-like [Rosa chinensis]XP_040374485.1 disease resistance protein At4g27190-like [Rosa chinensis]XP_040374486.1 disease resistance protein At4g27190-like [Rosa chinensis]XP_040374487.1 disease resistance protein At4g27190-like [Rosa chinensis]XP_040374488.1 disease resistance protein At4g27190-like [Rosa chinensi
MEFLVAIGTGIVGKIAEYTVAPVARQVGYLIHYNRNLKKLQSQLSDLDATRESVERKIDQEERRGRKVEAFVTNWLKDVNKITGEAKDILKDERHVKCLHGFCPNLKLRHQLSRKSTKLVQDVAELHEKKDFSSFAYEVNPKEVCSIPTKDIEVFDSRISVVKEIMDELRNSKICMIGVYGIGGVGKTTLVKQVYRQVTEHEKLFDDVVLVLDVKKNPSIERLQKEIAEKLGMDHRENETEAGRARYLCDRIKGKKMLLILDDVWERIDLESVGLPPLSTLKILLTSRSGRVLSSDMGTQKEFPLDVLDEKETWTLFEKMSGEIVKNVAIQSIATKVAKRCGGLPVLVVTVARALKNGTIHEWKDALRRLKKFDGQGLTEKAYSAIEWNYSKLDNEELKSLFILCGVVVGASNTLFISDLWKYSMGLGLLKDVDTVGEAWDALCSMIEQLKYSCLLLESDDNTLVRMHDLVKDVAKRIASREQHVLSLSPGSELKEWPNKDFCSKCTMISLDQCDIPEFPEVLQCQELTLFLLDNVVQEIPCNLFRKMKKLRVLDLTRFSIPLLPSSLQFLESLQTLCLDQCTLGDVTLLGQLQNLEILSFLYSKFKELPKEIGLLTRLRLLDLTGCSQLEVISPNVLSSLKRLEHLRMRNSFNGWEAGGVIDTEGSNANLEELKNLPHLTELQLHIPNANILPPDLFTGCKLVRFQICIGSVWKWDDVDEAINALKLQFTASNQFDQGLEMLLKRTEDLYLEGMEGVYSSIVYQLGAEGSHNLKHLHVQNNVEFTKFLSIINGKVMYPNLTWLAVNDLNGLKFLLSSSMARSLAQLKRLQVSGCQTMEEIVSLDESDEEIVDNLFCHVQDLELKDLPNLTKFCSRNYTELSNPSIGKLQLVDCNKTNTTCEEIEEIDSTRSLDIVIQHFLFDNKVEFPNLKKLSIDDLAKLTTIWNNQLSLEISKNLETIEIVSCDSLKSIFPVSVARNLRQLTRLIVRNCGVEEIIAREEGQQTTPKFVFPKVTKVIFGNMSQLKNFYPGMHVSIWPSLNELRVVQCAKVKVFAEEISNFQGHNESERLSVLIPQSLFLIEKDSFPKLECLSVNAMEFSNGPFPAAAQLFSKLKLLDVCCPESISAVFLEKLLDPEGNSAVGIGTQQLPHLKELWLVRMEKLMHLGQDDEEDNSQSAPRIPNFPNLQILFVNCCHSLRNLRSSAISFNNLTSLEVSVCYGLKYLMTYSMAKSLMQLTKLEVEGCLRLVEIVGGNEDDDSRNEITFRRLKHLKLLGLPRLQGFCSGNCIAKFPSLETSSMSNRLKLKIFTAHDQTLTNEEEDTDVDASEKWLTADDKRNLASTD